MTQILKPKGTVVYYIDNENKVQEAKLAEDCTIMDTIAVIETAEDSHTQIDVSDIWFSRESARKAVGILDMIRIMHEDDNNSAVISAIVKRS